MPESAEYKKAKASYGVLVDHFAFYASYHNNNINKWIHIIVSEVKNSTEIFCVFLFKHRFLWMNNDYLYTD